MTDAEVLEALKGDTLLNRARQEISSAIGRAEQSNPRRPIDIRREEFETVVRIAKIFGVNL